MNKFISIAFITMPCMVWGQKKEIETTAKITNVIVYTAAAEMNYEKEIILQKGKTTVVFTDLTPFITENSVNISVVDPAVSIVTVSERINYSKEKRNNNAQATFFQDSIARMNRQLGLIKCNRDVAESEKALLFKDDAIGGFSTKGVSVAELEKASAFYNKRYKELTNELFVLNENENNLNEKIKKYQRQIGELETVTIQNTSEIIVTVNSSIEKNVKIKFKFLTSKAGWTPVYDFKYDGPTKPLQFIFRANVVNSSGVSWQDVSLKLSTANPLQVFSLPSTNNRTSYEKSHSEVVFKQIEVINAITEYGIYDQYSIPSDTKPYLIDVSSYTIPANYNYLLIPKLDPFGFLMAKIPNWNKYNLIPGTTNIYNLGTYMGKTFLNTYSENDTLSLFLGKDKNIQSNRNEKSEMHSRSFAGNATLEETKTDIVIKNTFTNALPVEIIDQVPIFAKNDKEKISVYDITKAIYNEEEGLITWHYTIEPGQTIKLNYKYEIKAPKENYDGYRPSKKKFRSISCPAF